MRELLQRANLSRETMPSPQWDRLYAALANGGHLEGAGETKISPNRIREIRHAIPPLSLFGAALYSWMLPGHMSIGFGWPHCVETREAGLISSDEILLHAEDLIEEVSHVRHIDRDTQDPEVSGVTPMPSTMECLMTCTILEVSITLARHCTPIERAVLGHGLRRLETLGAKSGAGLGRVEILQDQSGEISDGEYLAWLCEPGYEDALRDFADSLVPAGRKKK